MEPVPRTSCCISEHDMGHHMHMFVKYVLIKRKFTDFQRTYIYPTQISWFVPQSVLVRLELQEFGCMREFFALAPVKYHT
eukprot:scaffold17839_cov72-Cyclotella_meneghiniana.AAC.6